MTEDSYSLGYLLTKSARVLVQLYQEEFQQKNLPVTPPQSGILMILHKRGTATQSSLATALHLDKTNISVMSKKLIEANLVRVKKKANDTRKNYLSLTPKGKRVCTEIMKVDHLIQKKLEKWIENPSSQKEIRRFLYQILTSRT